MGKGKVRGRVEVRGRVRLGYLPYPNRGGELNQFRIDIVYFY